jgi:transposase InsO family protein
MAEMVLLLGWGDVWAAGTEGCRPFHDNSDTYHCQQRRRDVISGVGVDGTRDAEDGVGLPAFQLALRAWEEGYNTVRPHQALGYETPQAFLRSKNFSDVSN